MSYIIIKSDGATLCTIQDGTINTTATSLGLPGRLYPSYGQVFDTNYVFLLENFANNTPPANPIRGQLWYDIGNTVLRICPIDGATSASQWVRIATTDNNGNITANNATFTGNIIANNATLSGNIIANNATANSLFVGNALGNAFIGFDSVYSGVGEFAGNANNYIEVSVYNSNTGTSASADFSLYDTGGLSSNYYIDIGINGKNFSQPGVWTINGPSDGYLYAGNSNLSIGTPSVGTFINFFTGNSLASNERMRIDTNGNVGINNTAPTNTLSVNGTAYISGNLTVSNVFASFYGSGAGLTSLPAGNVIGTVANATYATYSGQASTVTVADDSNMPAQYYPVFVSSAGISTALGIDTAMSYVASSNTLTVGNLIVSGSITGTATTATAAGTVTSAAQPNITSVGTLSTLAVIGLVTAGNISGGNTVLANFLTGTLTTPAQPNITSVGTLTSLAVTGNISGANLTGNHVGNGAGLTNINGANVTGTVANANYATVAQSLVAGAGSSTAVTVTGNAQPNITSVGTLTSLNSSGNITAPNLISTTGAFYGSGAGLTNIQGANVTGTVAYAAFANSVSGANVTGIVANANYALVAQSLVGGAGASTAVTVTGNAQPNITSVGILTSLVVTGNISGANLTGNMFGNGSGLSAIAGANVIGTVANANYATTAGTVSSSGITGVVANANYATYASTVITSAQPNITSVGSLTSLSVTGNISGNNLSTNGNLSVTGNINAGSQGISTSGNITGANVNGNHFGNGSGLSSLTAANITGTVANANYSTYTGTVLTNAQPNITSVGTLSSLSLSGNVTSTASIYANSGTVGASLLAGTLNAYSSSQPNITSVGTLTSLAVTGNISAANITANLFGNGAGLSNINGSNVSTVPNATTAATSGTVTTAAQPNITSVGILTGLVSSGIVDALTPNYSTTGGLRLRGNSISSNAYFQVTDSTGTVQWGCWQANVSGNIGWLGNLTTSGIFYGNGSGLSSIVGANVTGTVANATYATSAGSASSATTATTATTVSSISSSQVTSALGYTPYNGATNPAGFVPLSNFTEDFNEGGTSGLYYGGTHYGWTQLPNGLIIQWGNNETYHPGEGGVTVTFPVTFPNMVLTVMAVNKGDGYGNTGDDMWVQVPYIYNTGCTVFYQAPSSGNAGYGYRWVAFGY
jgi:hypothetical protein